MRGLPLNESKRTALDLTCLPRTTTSPCFSHCQVCLSQAHHAIAPALAVLDAVPPAAARTEGEEEAAEVSVAWVHDLLSLHTQVLWALGRHAAAVDAARACAALPLEHAMPAHPVLARALSAEVGALLVRLAQGAMEGAAAAGCNA